MSVVVTPGAGVKPGPRFPCPRCLSGTTKRALEEHEMCPSCWRVWTRPTLDETLAEIPQEWEQDVWDTLRATSTLALAASAMNRAHPIKGGRGWDPALVVMVDERRKRRKG